MERELRLLAERMERLAQRFDALHDALLRERTHLKARQPDKVEAEAAAIETLLHAIRDDDQERQKLVEQIGAALKLPPDQRTALVIDKQLKGKSGLVAPRNRLKVAAERADLANRENQVILQGLSDAAELLIKTLVDASSAESGGYTRKGMRRGSGNLSVFSRQL